MKVELNVGCYSETITAGNSYIEDLSCETIEDICGDMIAKCRTKEQLIEIASCIIKIIGEYKCDSDPCEQCGSWGETYTVE